MCFFHIPPPVVGVGVLPSSGPGLLLSRLLAEDGRRPPKESTDMGPGVIARPLSPWTKVSSLTSI